LIAARLAAGRAPDTIVTFQALIGWTAIRASGARRAELVRTFSAIMTKVTAGAAQAFLTIFGQW
jgi:hypothetical protein